MKISIKTLKGEQFHVEVNETDTVSEVKERIATERSDLPAGRQKLIHAGKVLKDTTVFSETGVSENDFIVCMVTKEAAKPKTPAAATSAAAAPAAAPAGAASATAAAPATVAPTPAATPQAAPAPTPAAPPAQPPVSPEALRQLMDMGFPEAECTNALRAANGNGDLAVEYLFNGIPDHALASMNAPAPAAATGTAGTATASPPAGGSSGSGIEQLRQHPQINQLRQLVQQNPASLSQVLEAIGQQNPELLQLIHANQAEFLNIMNEPIEETPAAPQPGMGAAAGGMMPGMGGPGGGQPNPMQLLQMLQALPPEQRAQAAQSLGMSPEQLQMFTQMIASMPPEQLAQMMGSMGGAGGMGGGVPPGANVVRLTEEEMQSVTRLTELGFDQQDAVAAYLACDKNEALAANLLLEGWSAGDDGGAGGM